MNPNDPKSPQEPIKPSEEPKQEKFSDKIRNINDGKRVGEFYDLAKQNKERALTYALIILGLIILFFNNLVGGLIIGMVAGYYFAPEITSYIRNLSHIISGHDNLRYVALTGLLLGLLIAAPGIFIGAAIVAAFKQVIFDKNDTSEGGTPL